MRRAVSKWIKSAGRKSLKREPATSHWIEALEDRRLLAATLVVTDSTPPAGDMAVTLPNTPVGGTSAPRTFTLQNAGDADLNITNFLAGGTNPGDFTYAVTDNGTPVNTGQPFIITAGQQDTVDVTFVPTLGGARSFTLSFNSDDVAQPAVTLTASGTGMAPSLVVADTVAPTGDNQLIMASTQVGNTSATEKFTLQNAGNAPLNITNFTRNGPNPVDFTYAVLNDKGVAVNTAQPFAIGAGKTYEVDIAFRPSAIGARSSSLTFTTNDPLNPTVTLSYSGTATAPPTTVPAAPTAGWAEIISSGEIRVHWTDNAIDEQGYFIYSSTNPAGPFTLKARTAANMSMYNYVGLKANTHYYFQVNAFNVVGLSTPPATANATTTPDLAGNTPAAAKPLGVISAATAMRDYVGTNDLADYYRFSTAISGTVRANLTELSAPVNVRLYRVNADNSLTLLAIGQGTPNAGASIAANGPAGIYMVQVFRGSSTTNSTYRLVLQDDLAGNTMATARNIGALGAKAVFSDYVGPTDTNDYYKFTLTTDKIVSVHLSGLQADIDLELRDISGTRLANSENLTNDSETLGRALAAGTYYVRILPFGQTGSPYKMTLSSW